MQDVYARVSGTWREVIEGYVRVSGVWRLVHQKATGAGWVSAVTTSGMVGWNNTQIPRYQYLSAYNKTCRTGFIQVRKTAWGGGIWAYRATTNPPQWIPCPNFANASQVDTHHVVAPLQLEDSNALGRQAIVIQPEWPLNTNDTWYYMPNTGQSWRYQVITNNTSPSTGLEYQEKAVAADYHRLGVFPIIRWTNVSSNTLAIYKWKAQSSTAAVVETIYTINTWDGAGLWLNALSACRRSTVVVRIHGGTGGVWFALICGGSNGATGGFNDGVIIRIDATETTHSATAISVLNSTHFSTTSFTPNTLRDFAIQTGQSGTAIGADGVALNITSSGTAYAALSTGSPLVHNKNVATVNIGDFYTVNQIGNTYPLGTYPLIYSS